MRVNFDGCMIVYWYMTQRIFMLRFIAQFKKSNYNNSLDSESYKPTFASSIYKFHKK